MLAATLADGHTTIRPAARSRRWTTSSTSCRPWAPRCSARARTSSRWRAAGGCAAPTHHVIADRIEAGTFAVAAAITGGEVTLRGAPSARTWAPSSTSSRRMGVDVSGDGGPHHRAWRRPGQRRLPGHGHRDRTLPRPGHGPPAAHLGAADAGAAAAARSTRSIFEDRLEWLDRPAPHGRHGGGHGRAPRHHHGPRAPAWRGPGDGRPARRSLAHPGRPGGRRQLAPSAVSTTCGGATRTSSASSSTSAPSIEPTHGRRTVRARHEDRHRPRHGQRARLREGQGHRHPRALGRGRERGPPHPGRGRGGARDDRPDPGQHLRHPAHEGRRHRRLRHHGGHAALLHPQGRAQLHQAGGHGLRALGRHQRGEARRPRRGPQGRRPRGLPHRGAAGGRHRRQRAHLRGLRATWSSTSAAAPRRSPSWLWAASSSAARCASAATASTRPSPATSVASTTS